MVVPYDVPDLPCRYLEVQAPPGRITKLEDAVDDIDKAVRADVQIQSEPIRVRWDGGDPAQNRGVKLNPDMLVTLHGVTVQRARFTPSAPGADLPPLFPSKLAVTLYFPAEG
jgi:hypothetical protein